MHDFQTLDASTKGISVLEEIMSCFRFFFSRSLHGIEEFVNLQELVLDNNCLGDDVQFPKLELLHTLTLNKNKVSFIDYLNYTALISCIILHTLKVREQLTSFKDDQLLPTLNKTV